MSENQPTIAESILAHKDLPAYARIIQWTHEQGHQVEDIENLGLNLETREKPVDLWETDKDNRTWKTYEYTGIGTVRIDFKDGTSYTRVITNEELNAPL